MPSSRTEHAHALALARALALALAVRAKSSTYFSLEIFMNTTLRSNATTRAHTLGIADWIALVLMIVGAINWGLVGAFGFDLVAAIFGEMSMASRIVYVLVGLAGLYGLSIPMRVAPRVR
jgi:uncharacterized membrane protein YuzA (DUF378 family)